MRMKPSIATCVETRNTRPFCTLATRRRPSRSPCISVTNESSPRTRSEASRATAVPLPMATATSAWWSAGASLTPSPVTATVLLQDRATSTMRSFCSGIARATMLSVGNSAARRASSHSASSGPVTTRSLDRPASAAIAAAVVGWSPVTTSGWMPAALARTIASRIPGLMRSANASTASGNQVSPSRRRASSSNRSPASAPVSTRACQTSRCAAGTSEHMASTASGAPRASSSSAASPSDVRVRARVREYGRSSLTGSASRRSAGSSSRTTACSARKPKSERLNEPGLLPVATLQASSSARTARVASSVNRSRPSTAPSGVRIAARASRFSVRVPVLSVTIRSTEPSVSWAERRRTRTFILRRR